VPRGPGDRGRAISSNFTPLFDGRTLAGWSIRQGPESAFYCATAPLASRRGFLGELGRQYEN
jgi:hypothetical protein